MSATGRIQVPCFYCQCGVLSPRDRVANMQGEGQLPSWPWTNGEENQATFLYLVTAPAMVEEAGFGAGSHHVLLTLALAIFFSDLQVRTALAHQSWRCPVWHTYSVPLQLCLTDSMPRSTAAQSNQYLGHHRRYAALLENWGDSLRTVTDSYWAQPHGKPQYHLLLSSCTSWH